jgi:hypothetical protein
MEHRQRVKCAAVTTTLNPAAARCANCAEPLTGPFCASCGQSADELRRPFRTMLADAMSEVFSLDARLARTVWPLLTRPGRLTKEYLSGRRAAHVPPLRTYLIAAVVFFGLFSLFPPPSPPVYVFTRGTPEAARIKSTTGSRVTFELPEHVPFGDRRFQDVSARARANPEAFARAAYSNIPRAFFLFLPVFALMLKGLYWKQGYYVEHLVFALYFQAFLFLALALHFAAGWLPGFLSAPLRLALVLWPVAYVPIALRRVYGGSRIATAFKSAALVVLYLFGFVMFGFGFVAYMAVLTF